jgi:hypothetical protein
VPSASINQLSILVKTASGPYPVVSTEKTMSLHEMWRWVQVQPTGSFSSNENVVETSFFVVLIESKTKLCDVEP